MKHLKLKMKRVLRRKSTCTLPPPTPGSTSVMYLLQEPIIAQKPEQQTTISILVMYIQHGAVCVLHLKYIYVSNGMQSMIKPVPMCHSEDLCTV